MADAAEPVADRRAGDRREPTSLAKDRRGKLMRWGDGAPVPFPVAPKEVFAALKAAMQRMPISYATIVNMSPVRSVPVGKMVATQPTVDPETVRQFVISPDMAVRMQKRASDGRLINLPFFVRCAQDPETVTHPQLADWLRDDSFFIFDGHHRSSAAVQRGEQFVNGRVATVGGEEGILAMAMSAVVADARPLVRLSGDSGEEVARVERDDDGIPTAFQIFPFGDVETSKGDFVFDDEAVKEVLAFYREQGNKLSIDYEHMAVTDPPIIAPAAGFFDLQMREDGLWAVDVQWTAKARAMLESGEYRYFSPCFAADKESNRITKLMNVALTNIPATKNMEPLVKSAMLVDATAALVNRHVFNKQQRAVVRGALEKKTAEILSAANAKVEKVAHAASRIEADLDASTVTALAAKKARRLATRGYVRGLKAAGFTIQSLIFPKKYWKGKSARKWVKDHDFAPEVDETKSSYRFRQKDPDAFDKLATICLTPGGTKPGDPRCRIKAVGGPLKSKTMVTPTPEAEESLSDVTTATAAEKEKKSTMARIAKKTKTATAAASGKTAEEKDPKKIAASQTAATELADSDSGDSDSGDSGDSGDSVDSAMAMGDSDSSDSDSDSDSSDSDSDDSAEMAAAADSADSGDSGDSADSGDSGDSGDSVDSADAGAVATKKTPLVPDTEEAAGAIASPGKSEGASKPVKPSKKKSRMLSLSTLVATITGSKSRKEQAGKLMALSSNAKKVNELSEYIEAQKREEKDRVIRHTVEKAIKKCRLAPARRDEVIGFGKKYGIEALNAFVSNLPKRSVNTEETAGGRGDHEGAAVAQTEVVAALAASRLTKEDIAVMRTMGISKEEFLKTRVAQTTGVCERMTGIDEATFRAGSSTSRKVNGGYEELCACTSTKAAKHFSKPLAAQLANAGATDYAPASEVRRAREIAARQSVESPLHFG